MLVIASEIVAEVKEVQPRNVFEPILVTVFGIEIEIKPVQLEKALVPMRETELEIVNELSFLQL